MAAQETRLSKITRPRAEGVLLRRELFRRLDQGCRHPLVWVSSPAGAGKTTLVSSYLQERHLPCLWYQVDAGDSDPATFFYYLGLAGKKAAPRRKQPLPLLTPEYLRGLADFSRNYFADLFERLKPPCVLVFDNLQDVPDTAPLHQCLIEGLSRIPEGVTIILVSRSAPPGCYLRFQANREMTVLGWSDLRLSLGEFEKVIGCWGYEAARFGSLPELYLQMDGWAAGLQLLLRRTEKAAAVEACDLLHAPEQVFDYFADQLFGRVEPEVQSCLLRTAFVSKLTLEMAARLTGNPRSKVILKELAHRNYFTSRRQAGVTTYEYHPLFQLFLQQTAEQTLAPVELRELKALSAITLLAESRVEEAVELLAGIADWEGLAILILEQARQLVDQGRFKTLNAWLEKLPGERIAQHPWLLYWKAVGLKPLDIFTSRDCFKQSYDLFRSAGDAAGSYLAWAGGVETFVYLWGNFRLLDPWLEEFEQLQQDHPEFPTPEIRGRVTYALFSALLWRRSDSAAMQTWSSRAEQLALGSDNPVFKILIGSNLLKFHLWCKGDMARADQLMATMQRIDLRSVPPLAVLLSKVMLATYHFFKNDMESCLLTTNEGLELGTQTGIHLLDTALCAHGVYAQLMAGEREQASLYLQRMGELTSEQSHLDVAHYHYLCAWMQLEEGAFREALSHARIAVERVDAAGTRQARGFGRYTLAVALCENGAFDEALQHLDAGRVYGTTMHNDYFESVYQLCLGLLHLRQGEQDAAVDRIARGLKVARLKDYPALPWIGWYRTAFAELLMLALEQRVEVDYVSRLIKRHRLVPRVPPVHLENWPWPLKLYTLGGFEIHAHGELLRSSGKAQQRPLGLLKALVAMGGESVAEERLTDALWPDADGDAAHQSLKSAVHRLRRLLGVPEAVVYTESCVSLDPRYCWVDVWALDRLLPRDRPSRLAAADPPALARGLGLYRGDFLANDPCEPWAVSARERWRSRFLHATELYAGHLEQAEGLAEAIVCYQKALEVDPLLELFYQRLMLCFARMGRPAEALSTYDRLKTVLRQNLGLHPSTQTESIRATFFPQS